MKTYSKEELKEVLVQHASWLKGEGGERADLRSADLRSADLRGANLRGANLRSADLRSADLRGANLRGADLRSANLINANLINADLRSADLSSANLINAELRGADLTNVRYMNSTIGNMRQLKSLQCDVWAVTYTANHMQIGCQLHTIQEWWGFEDSRIEDMEHGALEWWKIWKPILQAIIATSPAVGE